MDTAPIEKVLGAFEGVKRAGRNAWTAKCPAHHDTKPSLKLTLADDGVILTHCYTGCDFDDIVTAARLEKSDFFPPKGPSTMNGRHDENLGPVRAKGPRKLETAYEYHNAAGSPLFRVLRYTPKGFSQERWTDDGWKSGLESVARVPYHLPEVLATGPDEWIFFCEGEKDADNVRAEKLVATTLMGGAARKPSDGELRVFRGKRVALLYDNDAAGRDRAKTLSVSLAGIATEVRVLDLPSVPPKGDVSDWLGMGHSGADLLQLANTPPPPPRPEDLVPEAHVVNAADVTPEDVEWLWPGRLAAGKITLLEGDPGLGKSTLTIEISARLSRGHALPDGAPQKPMGVLFLSAEDGIADTIVPRLIAANADLSRIHFLEGIHGKDGIEGLVIPNDLGLVERSMAAWDCQVVIIDPLSAYFADNVNENKNQDVRKALAPLKSLLERVKASAICLRHLTKAQSATPIYRGAGSIGLGGAARIVLMVADDPDQDGVRVLAGVKENLSVKPQSLTYRVISAYSNPRVSQIQWLGTSVHTAKDLQGPPEDDLGPTLSDAMDWLRDYLRGGVIVMTKQLEKDSAKDGISLITLRRARKRLGLVAKKDGGGAWGVMLPELDQVRSGGGGNDQVDQDGPVAGEKSKTEDHLDHLPQNTHIYTHIYDDHLDDQVEDDHDHLAPSPELDQGDQGDHVSTEEEPEPW